MAHHQRPAVLPPVLVRETGTVLDTAGLATQLRGMAVGVPKSAEREY